MPRRQNHPEEGVMDSPESVPSTSSDREVKMTTKLPPSLRTIKKLVRTRVVRQYQILSVDSPVPEWINEEDMERIFVSGGLVVAAARAGAKEPLAARTNFADTEPSPSLSPSVPELSSVTSVKGDSVGSRYRKERSSVVPNDGEPSATSEYTGRPRRKRQRSSGSLSTSPDSAATGKRLSPDKDAQASRGRRATTSPEIYQHHADESLTVSELERHVLNGRGHDGQTEKTEESPAPRERRRDTNTNYKPEKLTLTTDGLPRVQRSLPRNSHKSSLRHASPSSCQIGQRKSFGAKKRLSAVKDGKRASAVQLLLKRQIARPSSRSALGSDQMGSSSSTPIKPSPLTARKERRSISAIADCPTEDVESIRQIAGATKVERLKTQSALTPPLITVVARQGGTRTGGKPAKSAQPPLVVEVSPLALSAVKEHWEGKPPRKTLTATPSPLPRGNGGGGRGVSEKFEVDKIIAGVRVKSSVYYLVQWKGYDETSNSWERKNDMRGAKDVIGDFHYEFGEFDEKNGVPIFSPAGELWDTVNRDKRTWIAPLSQS